MDRRQFPKTAAVTAGATIVPSHVLGGPGFVAPSDKLNIAGIGCGGQGGGDLSRMDKENIVALCDVDWERAAKTFAKYPAVPRYKDFRIMLEKQKDIDAVTVGTPDYFHAVAALAAIQLGKHVFVEKPLTHTIREARLLAKAAREAKAATQMGNQGHAMESIRLLCEWIWDGANGLRILPEENRLELNRELYDGVRFAWIHVKVFEKAWHIQGIRAVCQVKPTNYAGRFACDDPLLTKIWYTSAYSVKASLCQDYFGAILMERGDRMSWTGDAHPSQAAALVAFGNTDFIKRNIDSTAKLDNGIRSYSLYWILSLLDYYAYTDDRTTLETYIPNACAKLDAAYAVFGTDPKLRFYGWDERLTAGFEIWFKPGPETQNAYKMLSIRAWRDFAAAVLKIPRPELWSPNHPALYDIWAVLKKDGKVLDEVASYAGMRKISLGKDDQGILRLFLNNRPLFELGPLDQGWWWPDGLYTAPTDAALRFDLETIKSLGMNMLRKHVKVEPDRLYYWCDKLGLLVWQDMPSALFKREAHAPEALARRNSQWEGEWKAIIDTLRNHPSIVMWVPFNEGWGQYDTERIAAWTKKYDPTRQVNNASGGKDFGAGDVSDVHIYPGPGMPALEAGWHAVEFLYFQGRGEMGLEVSWQGPGFKKCPIPAEAFGR